MVISLSEDALRSVPRSLREAVYALGSTKFDVTVRVVVPAALSGIIVSFLLAVSRAIGETMAVTTAAGATPKLTLNPLQSVQTMTAYIVQVSQGDTRAGTIAYRALRCHFPAISGVKSPETGLEPTALPTPGSNCSHNSAATSSAASSTY